ncbi:MAG: class I SAM-dependent methyltransferase [Alphaproteobacteria bacterium]|nr:class I SAM-dependent methyltransferase [Alphaproteobacteria bacterium]
MSLDRVLHALAGGKPYFPTGLFGIQSAPERYIYMQATVHLLAQIRRGQPLRILEIGSWVGASALTWLDALDRYAEGKGEVWCCDLWEPYLEVPPERAAQALGPLPAEDVGLAMDVAARAGVAQALFDYNVARAGANGRVVQLKSDSGKVLASLGGEQFDLVYIDGDHRMGAVRRDIAEAKRLVRRGGIVCGDDLEHQLHEVDEAFARAQTTADWLVDPKSGQGYHPGVTVAVAEGFGRVSAYGGYWLMRRVGDGFQPVDLTGRPVHVPAHVPVDADFSKLRPTI